MTTENEFVAIVDDTFDPEDADANPFGKRWGGHGIALSSQHLAALQAGKTLALDVMSEYVVFIRLESTRHGN